MGLYLKFLALPFSTLTTEVLEVLVECLLSGRHTRARIAGTQAAFLLFTYSFSCGQVNIVCDSPDPSRKQQAPSTGHRLTSLGAGGMEEGLHRI